MLLLCTDTLRGYGLNRIFKLAKEAGYEGIDLSVDFGLFDTYNKEYIKELVDEYQLPVHAISAPRQVSSKKIKEIVEVAKYVGAKVIILQPPKIHEFKIGRASCRERV